MNGKESTLPSWVIVSLGEDLNWWLDETSEDVRWISGGRSVLDARQVTHLPTVVDEYLPYGLRREQVAAAFRKFAVESELSDGRLRLAPTEEDLFASGAQLFAIPLMDEDGTGPYDELLEALSAARIRMLNATHQYARECTELDMIEELDGLDRDRFFSLEAIHAFEEINEILQWSPAEWDES